MLISFFTCRFEKSCVKWWFHIFSIFSHIATWTQKKPQSLNSHWQAVPNPEPFVTQGKSFTITQLLLRYSCTQQISLCSWCIISIQFQCLTVQPVNITGHQFNRNNIRYRLNLPFYLIFNMSLQRQLAVNLLVVNFSYLTLILASCHNNPLFMGSIYHTMWTAISAFPVCNNSCVIITGQYWYLTRHFL